MSRKINIAIDAMGGENSPKKIIEGIKISLKKNKENFFHLYGKIDIIKKELEKNKKNKKNKKKYIYWNCFCAGYF